ncbi:MAG TPA: peptidyl-prolyl cis-trans isomerase [Acidobacteriaceae bacterium]|jgi:peptidyl-prolyl cis-trans isomerase D|nr:peptidyl-prolyl cis-trans isomerase [Acidobacteriaceae bacterium]
MATEKAVTHRMIRFLQKDTKFTKWLFGIIIAATCVLMVIFLVPGIFQDSSSTSTTYASIRHGGFFGRFLPAEEEIQVSDVQQAARSMMRGRQIPDMYMPIVMQQAGQQIIMQRILLQEAHRMGINATDDDVRRFLHTGMWGQYLFPDGKYIGDAQYTDFVTQNLNMTVQKFESEIKDQIASDRLRDLVTGGITVSDAEVRNNYRNQATKIKFDYAVLSADDLRKTINPTDTELQAYFRQNAARYKDALPETRKIEYITFSDKDLPGGKPQITPAEIQQYYQHNQQQYKVDAQVKVRHILISVDPNAGPDADAKAKAKAQNVLDQLRKDDGKNFAELAKQNSDDPGSKDQGGELGWLKRGATVPQFDAVAFAQKPGQISGLVRTQFGYHIIQTEDKQDAHLKTLDEVKSSIVDVLTKQKDAQTEQAFAQQLATQAQQTSLAQAAAARHLKLVTSDYVAQGATLPNLGDSSKLIAAAFGAKASSAPEPIATGDTSYAVFQVADIKAAHTPTFDEYKSHVLDDFRDQQVTALLARKTNELADRAHAEHDLAKAAKEVGATIKTSDLVGRDQQVPDVGQLSSAAPSLFDLSVGAISNAINNGTTGVVAKIDDKQEPSTEDIAKNLDSNRDTLLTQRRDQAFEVFVTNLVSTYEKADRVLLNRKMQEQAPLSGM